MARGQLDTVLRHLRSVLIAKDAEHLTDADLVRRFVNRRDDAAFTVLVRRHGGLVLNVCRNVLKQDADAEEAFQSTFLILARKAVSIRNERSIAGWLHEVAFRCARDLRKSAMRRNKREQTVVDKRQCESPLAGAALNELQSLLDEEIQHLSATRRTAFVLCVLEGKSRAEAAQTLGCTEGTLASRLARAREILQKRLTARGVTLPAALAAVAISPNATSAVSASLANATTDAALAFASGNAVGTGSSQVLTLAQGALQGMLITKLKIGAALMVSVCLSVAAASGFVAQPGVMDDPAQKSFAGPQPAEVNAAPKAASRDHLDSRGDLLPEAALARLGNAPRWGHAGSVHDSVLAPDGKTVATAGARGVVIWDLGTGKVVRRFFGSPFAGLYHGLSYSNGCNCRCYRHFSVFSSEKEAFLGH